MKLTRCFTWMLAFVNILGCNKQSTSEAIDTTVVFKVENAQGQNLLDPATTGYFKPESIKIFYLVNGEKKLYNKPNLDYPHGYRVVNAKTSGYAVTVFVNNENPESPTTTYIDWSNGDTDTLVCAMIKKNGVYQNIAEAWYNEEKISNRSGGINIFKIVK